MNDSVAKVLEGFAPMTEDQASRYNKQGTFVAVLEARLKQYMAEEELAKVQIKSTRVSLSMVYAEINKLNQELGIKGGAEEVKEFEGRLHFKRLAAPEPVKLELVANEAK